MRFYTNENKSGGTYDNGVEVDGSTVTLDVTSETPEKLYYQCSAHPYMGNYGLVLKSEWMAHFLL